MAEAQEQARSRSGSEKRQRRHSRPIRLDDGELAEVEEAASRRGLTFSSFSRAAMLSAARGEIGVTMPARSVRRPPIERELLARVLGQLGKIGSNLNQVGRAANMGRAEGEEIAAAVAEVRGAATAVMQAMGRRA